MSGRAAAKGAPEQLVCGVGVDEEGTIPPPSVIALNAGLDPAHRSVWASLIPSLVPEHYHGNLTNVGGAPEKASPRKGSATEKKVVKLKGRSRKLPPTIVDRLKPEAPISDMVEVEMLWQRISNLVPPKAQASDADEDTSVRLGSVVVADTTAKAQSARGASRVTSNNKPTPPPLTAQSARRPLTNQTERDGPIPRIAKSPAAVGGDVASTTSNTPPRSALHTPVTPRSPTQMPPFTASHHNTTAQPDGASSKGQSEAMQIPTHVKVFNTEGIFEGATSTGGIYTVSFPGAISGTSVQPRTTVIATRSTVRSSANNQLQQPRLASTYRPVASHKQNDRPAFNTKSNAGKKPAIAPELLANYGNTNAGTSEATEATFYTFSNPYAIPAGPHTGSIPVPLQKPSTTALDRNGQLPSQATKQGVLLNMLSPTVPRLLPDQNSSDPTDDDTTNRFAPRPPRKGADDGSHPERSAATLRHDAARRALNVAHEALAVSTDRKVGHTLLILHEREVAKRERKTIEERIEVLNAIYAKATEEHKSVFSTTQQRYDTELYQYHNELNEALKEQERTETLIEEEVATMAAIENTGDALIAAIRDHGIALKTLAREHADDRALLTETMTNKLRRSFEEMKAVTAAQRAERQGRAHLEAARLGKELSVLDKTNRDLTARLSSIKSTIANAARDTELERQRSGLLQSKHTKLTAKVSAVVEELREFEENLLRGEGGDSTMQPPAQLVSSITSEINRERDAIGALQQRIVFASNELNAHRQSIMSFRGALLDRLQYRTKAPVAFEIMRGLRAALSAEEKRSAASSRGGEEPSVAPEPDIETKPTHSTHSDPLPALTPAAVQGLLPIGAIIQETLEDVLDGIIKQRRVAEAHRPLLQAKAHLSFGNRSLPTAVKEVQPTDAAPINTPRDGVTSQCSASFTGIPQLRNSSISAMYAARGSVAGEQGEEGSVQILNLDPSSMSSTMHGVWGRGSIAGPVCVPAVLQQNSHPPTPTEVRQSGTDCVDAVPSRHVRIAEVDSASPLAATTLHNEAIEGSGPLLPDGFSDGPNPFTPRHTSIVGVGSSCGRVLPPAVPQRVMFAAVPPVMAEVRTEPASTSVTAVSSLLDIADPADKRIIQDYIIRRINRKLSQVLPSAPAVSGI